jgi:hypothetical protein
MTRKELHTRATCLTGRLQSFGLLLLLATATVKGWPGSRERRDWDPRLQYSDMAALASSEQRSDFSCQVTSDQPSLGFDLRSDRALSSDSSLG